MDPQVHEGFQDLMEQKDVKESQVKMHLVLLELKDVKEKRVMMVNEVQEDFQDKKVKL